MAVKLSANYSKKLGLPNFSSHSFSASVEVELTDLSQVGAEVQKLYELLQHSVDQEIQNTGFVPDSNTNGSSNGHSQPQQQTGHAYQLNGHHQPRANGDSWSYTEGQRGFILRIVNENNIPKEDVENLSQQLFSLGVKQLNKMQASQLIEDLLVKAGKPAQRQSRWQQQRPTRQAA